MKVTVNRAEQGFQPIELKIVIETQEEFKTWYNITKYGNLAKLTGVETNTEIFNQLKQFKDR